MESIEEQMDAVKIAIDGASEYGLEVEVITWALKALKKNPELNISEAVSIGFYEWVK
jgi:hypothetical protein